MVKWSGACVRRELYHVEGSGPSAEALPSFLAVAGHVRGRFVGYGLEDGVLRPVFVQHDRSRPWIRRVTY